MAGALASPLSDSSLFNQHQIASSFLQPQITTSILQSARCSIVSPSHYILTGLTSVAVRRFPSLRSSFRSPSSSNENCQLPIVRRPSVQPQVRTTSQNQVRKYNSALSDAETLVPIDEEERYDPYFDRTVDLLATAAPQEISIDQTEVFEQLLKAYDEKNGKHLLSVLPANIRYKIYGFCFDDEQRKISLSPKFATRAVFPDHYFASPWNVLDPVWGGIHAFRALRHDLVNYFWTTYHFHITLNVFSGPVFSPLSHVWLLSFLDRIQRLTIESDFTRFGGSSLKIAPAFGHNNDKVEELLLGLIKRLLERPDRLTMAEMHLMCRRYAGCRPNTDKLDSSAAKFCPDNPVYLFDAMTNLRGILQRCRVSGFTLDYTKHILSAAFADGDKEPKFIKPNDCAWPPVSARSVTNPSYASSLHPVSEPLGLRLHHSRSFAEEVEEGMKRFSILSSRSIVSHTDGLLEEQRRRDQSNDALTDDTQQYSSTRESMFSNFTSQNEFESPPDASTPRLQQGEIMCTRTFEVSEGTRTPSPERCSTPKSPETLNKLNERDPAFIRTLNAIKTQSQIEANEQDPAFIRSVEGLRSNPQTETPPILGEDRPRSFMPSTTTTIQSPAERSALSMSARTNETTGIIRRRYLSFVGRLRGRADT